MESHHDKKVTSKPLDETLKCNRRKKPECPMKGNSQVNAVVYRWDVTRSISKKFNLGLEEGE